MHYHHLSDTRSRLTLFQMQDRARQFQALHKLEDIAATLKLRPRDLRLLGKNPVYESFYLPKPQGGYRLIQAPAKALKSTQSRLARCLQWTYTTDLPEAAYGFVLSPADTDAPRNIYTNALYHQGQKWVLNLDLTAFFHHISRDQVVAIFQEAPFAFSQEAAYCLGDLCTFEGRLPMGAPTSPVLSNLAARPLDSALTQLAQEKGWRYTRYADDLTFSSQEKMVARDRKTIGATLAEKGFAINTKKLRLQHRKDPPEITGLLLYPDGPDVSPTFLAGIRSDLQVLAALGAPEMIYRGIFTEKPIKRLRQSIQGQLNFLKFIRGKDHRSVRKLEKQLRQMAQPQ